MRRFLNVVLLFTGLVFLFVAASVKDEAEEYTHFFSCTTASPTTLNYGLRGSPDSQGIDVTSTGTWEFYALDSWLRVNGNGTYIGSGNGTVQVTLSGSIPAGSPYFCGGTITTGHILLVDYNSSCPNITITVNYIICPCC